MDTLQKEIISELRKQFVKMGFLSDKSDGRICIGLSGGIDSTTIGLVADHLGLEVNAISYKRKDFESSDYNQAKKTCEILGWKFHTVVLKEENPKDVFLSMIKDYNCKRKTEIECLYPYLPIFETAIDLGFEKLMVGFNTSPDNRKTATKCRQNPGAYWNDIIKRTETYREVPTITKTNGNPLLSYACRKLYEVGKQKGIRVVAPMWGKKYNTLFQKRNLTPNDMNKGYNKSYLKLCFPEQIEKIGMTKTKQMMLQKGGGIESFFEPIIYDKEINFKDYKTDNVTSCLTKLSLLWGK